MVDPLQILISKVVLVEPLKYFNNSKTTPIMLLQKNQILQLNQENITVFGTPDQPLGIHPKN